MTNGKTFKVDDKDYKKLSKYKWNYHDRMGPMCNIYAKQLIGNSPDKCILFVTKNTLDLRRKNLILSLTNVNPIRVRKTNRSGNVGVSWNTQKQAWKACITHKKQFHWLGYHNTVKAAAKAYMKKYKEFYQ